MRINDLSTQILYTTVPIWVEKKFGGQSSGTGFFFSFLDKENPNQSIPLLVTNYHVIQDITRGIFEFVLRENDMPTKQKIRVEFDPSVIRINEPPEIDLVAIPIAPIINELEVKHKPVFFRSITQEIIPDIQQINDLSAIEEVIFIGYPSGLSDSYNMSPIVRRGITATPVWNKFKGKDAFLIDAGVFPGSSGSPVFLFNQGSYSSGNTIIIGSRIFFLGILAETFIGSVQSNVSNEQSKVFLGLGEVINSNTILEYLNKFISQLKIQTKT